MFTPRVGMNSLSEAEKCAFTLDQYTGSELPFEVEAVWRRGRNLPGCSDIAKRTVKPCRRCSIYLSVTGF